MNGERVGVCGGSQEGENRVFDGTCLLSSLGMVVGCEERSSLRVCCSANDETGTLDIGGESRGEDLYLGCLILRQDYLGLG